jgi:hypothetical protein
MHPSLVSLSTPKFVGAHRNRANFGIGTLDWFFETDSHPAFLAWRAEGACGMVGSNKNKQLFEGALSV